MALHHPQGVAGRVLARHKPGRVLAATALGAFGLEAAYAQALALAQGVKAQAHVLAHGAPALVLDGTGLFGDVAVQKITKRALANEADAGGIFFAGVG